MIIAFNTSTPTCYISVFREDAWHDYQWEAGRSLANNLLGYLDEIFKKESSSFSDISGIIAYQGPGSFTGLRIGLTVFNTLADSLSVPIVGVTGDDWKQQGVQRLNSSENDQLVMPEYGGVPHITTPRK